MKYRFRAASKAKKTNGRKPKSSLRKNQLSCLGETLEVRLAMAGNTASAWQNPNLATDVNVDGRTSASDVMALINELNANGSYSFANKPNAAAARMALSVSGGEDTSRFYDVNGDNRLSPADALKVINTLKAQAGETVQFRLEATDLSGNVINSFRSALM
jgi:hypothetical protein